MLGSTHIVGTNQTAGQRGPVENAERRLTRARAQLAAAESIEEFAEVNVQRHGGPGGGSPALVGRWIRTHERVFVCQLEVQRCERVLADAHNQNGGGAV